jgi:hypothetical protein
MTAPRPQFNRHRRFHPRHLTGFRNLNGRNQADHLRWEHNYRPDGLDLEAMERAHNSLHDARDYE